MHEPNKPTACDYCIKHRLPHNLSCDEYRIGLRESLNARSQTPEERTPTRVADTVEEVSAIYHLSYRI